MKIVDHSGSGNHGCEALLRTTIEIIGNPEVKVFSHNPQEDVYYGTYGERQVHRPGLNRKEDMLRWVVYTVLQKAHLLSMPEKTVYYALRSKPDICVSIGGDNYCYDGLAEGTAASNIALVRHGNKTVLWGCSIDEKHASQSVVWQGLKQYSLITARESITYDLLKGLGIKNVHLFPDPAFTLQTKQCDFPEEFMVGNTIGINVSPLIQSMEDGKGMTHANYAKLLTYILTRTDSNIALIPHVVWSHNNDLEPLTQLYDEFKHTGRVCLIDENKSMNCMELKYVISQCKMMVAARTHASIAAYSTCVPTLVVGYSVKSRGIAKDIFGTSDNYVIPVQSFSNENDLTKAFQWLENNQDSIRAHLEAFMPDYIQRAWLAGDEVRKLI